MITESKPPASRGIGFCVRCMMKCELFQRWMCIDCLMLPLVELVEDSIRRGLPNAMLIEWAYREIPATLIEESRYEPDPVASITAAVDQFRPMGWKWAQDGSSQLEKDGWLIWFRSQGQLSPPIIQWSRI